MAVESGTYTPEVIARRLELAKELMAPRKRPIIHWAQGLEDLANTAVGAMAWSKAEREEREGAKAEMDALREMWGARGGAAPPPAAAPMVRSDVDVPPAAPGAPPVAPIKTAALTPPLTPEPPVARPPLDLPVMNLTDPRVTPLGESIEPLPPAPRPGPARVAGLPGAPMPAPPPMSPAAGPVAAALNAPAAPTPPPPAVPPPVPPVAAALNAPAAVAGAPTRDAVAAMLASRNPRIQRMGAQFAKAALAKEMTTQPEFSKLDDDTLYEKHTGKTMGVGTPRRNLLTPEERAAFGIPADDKRPYQVGPAGKLERPPAETRVSIDQRAESAFDVEASKLTAGHFNDLVKSGMASKEVVADLKNLQDIATRITTGKSAQFREKIGPYAELVGFEIKDLPDLQVYESVVNKMAPGMRPPGSGATSDFDLRTYFKAIPGLALTPEGNALINQTTEAMHNHRMAAADIASRALAKEITPREAHKLLRELPDPFTAWRAVRDKKEAATPATPPPTTDLKKKYGLD